MRTLVVFPVLFLLLFQMTSAQNDSISPKRLYKIWIKRPETREKIKAVLFDVRDSSIMVSDADKKSDYRMGKYNVTGFSTPELDVLKIRRNKNINRCALIGTGTGFLLMGTLITAGYHSTSSSKEQRTKDNLVMFMWSGAWGALFGALTGAMIGSFKVHIPINGNQGMFNSQKERLQKYSVKYYSGLYVPYIVKFSRLPDTIRDVDGNRYPAVALGGQVWMAKNLNATRYRDGSEISSHAINKTGKECQYTWEVINDRRGLCPMGWHVPSGGEWTSFISSLGDDQPGKKMEEGFAPGHTASQWWSATEKDSVNSWSVYLDNRKTGVMTAIAKKSASLSVRCIRD